MSIPLEVKAGSTYRLKGIPRSIRNKDQLQEAIKAALGRCSFAIDIIVCSLAWDCVRPHTKVATLSIRGSLPAGPRDLESFFSEDVFPDNQVSVDKDFEGLTTLYCPDEKEGYAVDLIIVPGLGSHPIDTFVHERRQDFVWPRDALPEAVSDIRVMVWGYESDVVKSENFQNLDDISTYFRETLRIISTNMSGESDHHQLNRHRPLMLLGVGLGGLVIQNAIKILAESTHQMDKPILYRVCHLFLFGVPKQGLHVEHFMQIVRGAANEQFILNLASGSVLTSLQRDFFRVMKHDLLRDTTIWSFYETKKTPLLVQEHGMYVLSKDQAEMLVSKESATHAQAPFECGPDYTVPLPRNHHDLVRMTAHDDMLGMVLHKIKAAAASSRLLLENRLAIYRDSLPNKTSAVVKQQQHRQGALDFRPANAPGSEIGTDPNPDPELESKRKGIRGTDFEEHLVSPVNRLGFTSNLPLITDP